MRLHFPRHREPAASFESDPKLTNLLDQLRLVDSIPVPALRFEFAAARQSGGQLRRSVVPTRRGAAYIVLGIALFMAAGFGLAAGLTRDGAPPASAAAILDRAGRFASVRDASAGTGSFHKVTRAETDHGGRGVSVREWRQWGDGPDRWRVEVYAGTTTGDLALESVRTSDGTTLYTFEAASGELTTEPYDPSTWRVYGSDGGLGEAGDQANLEAVLAAKEGCYTPALAGKESVAGREAYVIDLGSNRCVTDTNVGGGPGGAPVYGMVPSRLWVDTETFSVVRVSKAGGPGGQLRSTTTVVAYERSIPMDANSFIIDPRQPAR